jgi:hypothetical protein
LVGDTFSLLSGCLAFGRRVAAPMQHRSGTFCAVLLDHQFAGNAAISWESSVFPFRAAAERHLMKTPEL